MLIAQVTPAVLLLVTVAQGTMSNIEEPRTVVVRATAARQALWKEHDPEHAVPAVDFAQSTVVGVFLGSRPSAGFAVEITGVKTERDRTIVEYVECRLRSDNGTRFVRGCVSGSTTKQITSSNSANAARNQNRKRQLPSATSHRSSEGASRSAWP